MKTQIENIAPETMAGDGTWQPLLEEGWVHGDGTGTISSAWKHFRFNWPFVHLL